MSAFDPKRTFLLRGYSEGKSARYRLARISTSRSTYRHSAVLRSRRTIFLKGIGVFGGVLEPSQEVEWLSKFSAVMQPSRYGRQVLHTNPNVPRLLLEDGSAFILR